MEEKHRVSIFPSYTQALWLVPLPLPWQHQPKGQDRSPARLEEAEETVALLHPALPPHFPGREQLFQTRSTPQHTLFYYASLTFSGGSVITIIEVLQGMKELCKSTQSRKPRKALFAPEKRKERMEGYRNLWNGEKSPRRILVSRPKFRAWFDHFLSYVT